MNLIGRLQTVSDCYCAQATAPRERVSRVLFGDQRRLDAVFSGSAGLTVANFEKAMLWFSANWPEALAWPEGIERPFPADEIEVAAVTAEGAAA